MLKLIRITCILLYCSTFQNYAQGEKNDPTRWTPKDIVNTESLSSASFSPDNSMVVWTKRKGVKEKDKFVSDIYLTLLNTKKDGKFRTVHLTNGDDNDYSPLFSKNGESIYFLSSRDKGKKLWKLSIYGGEAQEVHEFKNGISSIQLKDDNTLLFLSNDGNTLYEAEAEENKDDVQVIEDSLHWTPNHIYAYDLKEKSVSRLTNNEKSISSFEVSRDGKWLFYNMQRSLSYATDAQKDPFYYLKNLETGNTKQIITDLDFPVYSIKFTPDNSGFYFMSSKASDPKWNGAGIEELYFYNLADSSYKKVPLDWELGASRGFDLVGNDVIVSLANRATMRLAYYKKKGDNWSKSDIDLDEKNDHTSIETVSEDGTKVVYTYSTASKLPTTHVADLKGSRFSKEEELVELNKNLKKKSITKSEIITWKGWHDEEVTGILYYPENYEEGKKYPLMLSIHGGPSSMDLDTWSQRWSTYPNLLAQKGMFILKPNYHGSSNHGLSYVESIKQNYYDPEMEDITKGIKVLEEQGKVDPDQLGTMGWSNGAILTTMLTVRYPDMFKVAAPGAGDVNWTSDFGTCRFGVSFDEGYFGGAPWDDTNGKIYNENYIIKSPLFEIEKIKTPTIIFHGSEDRAVPRDQGWEYYRGLQQVAQAPVKFLWFPGQPHGLGKITHQLRKMNEEIAWIEKYLLNKPSTKNEAFKEDSPLAEAIKLDEAKKVDGLYGEIVKETLIPETVLLKKDSISLGRFEVTNAQFLAFKPDFSFPAGHDNYPVETDKASAKAYAEWLSTKTGDTYRLPNTKEAKDLQKKARKNAKNENNLNHWAGYDLVKEDVPQLLEKVKEVKGSLLAEVGSFKSTKVEEAAIFDLGGNVAEYADDGIYGYSAYDFYDDNEDSIKSSDHVGFRVIKEAK
tara:strand:+ start:21393 stop:24098 length:2706 start_codon:yes stop_codon:yes gene_type:complete